MPNRTPSPLTLLFLLLTLSVGATECVWKGIERIVAVGDVHGDFTQFVKVLRAAKIINEKNQWIAGKTHLVQTGDVLDRGPDSKKAMDLLMHLEKQALKAHGRVHALIGNHEAMIMLGDHRYRHPDEVHAHGGTESFEKAMSASGKYGKWISGHNTVIKINDVLFVHGGISPEYAKTPLSELNERVRKQLQGNDRSMTGPVGESSGPLWYRGYAYTDEEQLNELIDPVLKEMGANHVVVGHTVMKGGIRVRGDGKVVMIDVGMSKHYGGPAECIIIEDGNWYSAGERARKRLPVRGKRKSEEPSE